MKKIFLPFLILFSLVSIVSADVNFQYEFIVDKVFATYNHLFDTYVFDYDNNGIDDYVVDYGYIEWELYSVLYDQNGTVIDTLFNDFCTRNFLFKDAANQNKEIYVENCWDSIKVFLQDYNTRSVLDTLTILKTAGHCFDNIYSYKSYIMGSNVYVLICLNQGWHYLGEDDQRSYIFKIKIENDVMSYVEDFPNVGYENVLCNDKLLSVGVYSEGHDNGAWGAIYWDYYLKSLTLEAQSDVVNYHYSAGGVVFSDPNEWMHCPRNYRILTGNPLGSYPHILYYQKYDSDDGDSLYYYAYDLLTGQNEWLIRESLTESKFIRSSTCVTVNDEYHYVMYFYDNHTLEIRDRLNGNIVHQQDSVFTVNDIIRKSNGDLLFFVEKNDETGYDVYSLDGPIFVSNDEPSTQNEFVIEQYPNPFRNKITFSFTLKEPIQNAEIKIYNIKGQLVRELRPFSSSALHHVETMWDGKDENGIEVKQGIYLYQVVMDDQHYSGKIIKIK